MVIIMGLSRLSEKCQRCKHKDVCDNKQMEACGYITSTIPKFAQTGLPVPDNVFMFHGNSGPEMVGSLNGSKYHANNNAISDAISSAVSDAIKNLDGKTFSFEILPKRKTNEKN